MLKKGEPPNRSKSLGKSNILVAHAVVLLAPVRSTTEVRAGSAEVAAGAAEARSTFLVDNRTAILAGLSSAGGLGGLRRLSHRVTLSVARLAASSAVDGLVLDIVLGAAVAGR
jgi:hypothetical protein